MGTLTGIAAIFAALCFVTLVIAPRAVDRYERRKEIARIPLDRLGEAVLLVAELDGAGECPKGYDGHRLIFRVEDFLEETAMLWCRDVPRVEPGPKSWPASRAVFLRAAMVHYINLCLEDAKCRRS